MKISDVTALVAALAALVVALGHLWADITGRVPRTPANAPEHTQTAGGEGENSPPAAGPPAA